MFFGWALAGGWAALTRSGGSGWVWRMGRAEPGSGMVRWPPSLPARRPEPGSPRPCQTSREFESSRNNTPPSSLRPPPSNPLPPLGRLHHCSPAVALAPLGLGLRLLTWNICENWSTFCPSSTISWPVTRTRIDATVALAGCASRVTTRCATFVNGRPWRQRGPWPRSGASGSAMGTMGTAVGH